MRLFRLFRYFSFVPYSLFPMKILTAQQMREIDRLTVERVGVPYSILMENAGSRVVDAIIEHFGPPAGQRYAVFCGKGNNGGDGAVIARLLSTRGAEQVSIFLLGSVDETKGEARTNLEILKRSYLRNLDSRGPLQPISFAEITDHFEPKSWDFGSYLVIDALLGTGITRAAEGLYARAIEFINGLRASGMKVVSVDIPSGLSSDSGHPIGPLVNADLTVTFTAPKIGNVFPPACYANGELVVSPIGTPDWLLNESGSNLHLVEQSQVREFLSGSQRAPAAHKGSVGDVLLIAGSRGKTGAAALASEAVLRAGAGLVTVATSRSAQDLLITQVLAEVMTEPLDELGSGAISETAMDRALQLAEKRTVLALGPGLSSSDESTRRFVREFIEKRRAPVVIDADGLNSLAPWPEQLKGSEELPVIITPHPGEMARLTGKTNAEVIEDRTGIAREFAVKYHIITVLKGSRTIIAAPGGSLYVNPTSNAGMATAGSGDVLTGLLAGLLAQYPQVPLEATIAAVYLHGLSGDIAAQTLGMRSLIASDIIDNLSKAILLTGGDSERGHPNTITTI
jgi:ADP-dependent NAD(P)H-hydrate dehydratase / NAD(P)H-hydrate epimerase